MRIAVTGGRGQIGQAVVELAVAQGHTVVSIDVLPPGCQSTAPRVTCSVADVTRYAELEQALAGCDGLVHLAAIRSPLGRPDYEVHSTNVVASYNALSAAARLGIRRVAQASSINAMGAAFSRWPRYDYFPLDEQHPTYTEDPYSLSKWICEQQADAFARRYDWMSIASLRFHLVVAERSEATRRGQASAEVFAKHLWGYTRLAAAARACVLALTAAFTGHAPLYIVAPETVADEPSLALQQRFYAAVPLRRPLVAHQGFYDCSRAERVLGWRHDG